jgi:uncharacterized protein YcbK (DUF882 family)
MHPDRFSRSPSPPPDPRPAAAPPPAASRRSFLALALALPATLAPPLALPARAALAARELILHHRHTGETWRAVYFAGGRYRATALGEASRVLRDWRTGQARPIDPRLLDILHELQQRLGARSPIEVLCGYRSPETNAMLRRKSRAVARNSLHMQGMAADLRFAPDRLPAAHRIARALAAGGVGYYPGSGFIHVDSGSVRHWQQGRPARRRAG